MVRHESTPRQRERGFNHLGINKERTPQEKAHNRLKEYIRTSIIDLTLNPYNILYEFDEVINDMCDEFVALIFKEIDKIVMYKESAQYKKVKKRFKKKALYAFDERDYKVEINNNH